MSVPLCTDVGALRGLVAAWRGAGERVALVPTMGALHAGHMRLVEVARSVGDRVILTIFVNPTQFAPGEDFDAYPRALSADCVAVHSAGGDLVYAPVLSTMYPSGFATLILVDGPATAGLEDRFRPDHFAGVATIVAKLLMQAQPDIALFGEKDFQQLRVIERMVADLDMPIEIMGVPSVREADGLALSSRNIYLEADERHRASVLHGALADAAHAIEAGDAVEACLDRARQRIEAAGFAIDYVEARDAGTLGAYRPGAPGRILTAARMGRTRLIDNVAIGANPPVDAPRGDVGRRWIAHRVRP